MATKSLTALLDKQTLALQAQALEQLCHEARTAIMLCADADDPETIDVAREMYNEAQELARGLGYVLIVRPVSAEPGCDWNLTAMELVSA
jgi:hypothetical protein